MSRPCPSCCLLLPWSTQFPPPCSLVLKKNSEALPSLVTREACGIKMKTLSRKTEEGSGSGQAHRLHAGHVAEAPEGDWEGRGAPLDKTACEESQCRGRGMGDVTFCSWPRTLSSQARSLYKHVCGVQISDNLPYDTRVYSEIKEPRCFLSGVCQVASIHQGQQTRKPSFRLKLFSVLYLTFFSQCQVLRSL